VNVPSVSTKSSSPVEPQEKNNIAQSIVAKKNTEQRKTIQRKIEIYYIPSTEFVYMKNFYVLGVIAFSIFFFACEEEVIPIPLPPSQPVANMPAEEEPMPQVPAEKPSEPAKTVKVQTKESAKVPAKEPAKTVAYSMYSGDVDQLSTGRYIIQVAIFPVEASAKKLIKKLAENGIKAYSARVDNPSPEKGMIGIYYRVRIGFFDARTSAEAYAKTRLEPIGYAWWVDRSKNDNIGSNAIVAQEPEPFVVERIPEQAPKQMSEQERKDAERAAAIAAAKEEYKAIAKAANATAAKQPSAPKAATQPALKATTPPAKTSAPAKNSATKEAQIDSRGRVKMKSKR
jgi:hypothetical protein